jgi:O-antigen ligase
MTRALAARRVTAEIPLLVICTLFLSTGADILPPDSLISVGQVKLDLARVLLLVGFAALVYTHGPRRDLFASGLAIPLALLLAAGLVATLKWSGTEPRYRFLVEAVALLYLTQAAVRARPEARVAVAAVALVAVAVSSLGGLAQVSQGVATGFYRHGCVPVTQAPPIIPSGTITRATGSFANPNLLAAHVLLLAPLAAAALVVAFTGWRVRLAVALTIGLAYLGLVFTFSRTGILLALLAAAAAVLSSRLPQRRYLAALGVAVAVVAFLLLGSCGSEGAAGFGRTQEWKETMHVIRDHPLYGVGLGRLGDVLHARNPLSTSQHAHNLLLDWWAEAGPLALIAWIWLFAALIARSLRAALSGDVLGRGALAALVGFGGYSMLDHPANVDRIAIALWGVMGVAAALPRAPFAIPRLRRRHAHA